MTSHDLSAPFTRWCPAVPADSRAVCRSAAFLMMLMTLMGWGKSTGGTESAPIVKYDGKRRKCVVVLPTEAQGSVIACDDVVAFVKDELRVPGNSIYDLGTIPESDPHPVEIARVRASLDGAGYRFIGGPHKGF